MIFIFLIGRKTHIAPFLTQKQVTRLATVHAWLVLHHHRNLNIFIHLFNHICSTFQFISNYKAPFDSTAQEYYLLWKYIKLYHDCYAHVQIANIHLISKSDETSNKINIINLNNLTMKLKKTQSSIVFAMPQVNPLKKFN